MKKEKVLSLIIISLFLVVLYAPFLSFQFLNKYLSVDNSENRVLASKPTLDISNLESVVSYPKLFDSYWNDHLPYRNLLKRINSSVDYNLFGVSPDSRVIIGKNDGKEENTWLFYNKMIDGNPMGDVLGTKTFSDTELKKMCDNIANQTKLMKEKNIDLYYMIAPNKSTVYSEKLPDRIKVNASETRSEKAIKYFNKNGVNNIKYIKNELEEASKKYDTYYHIDTHWNEYGGFVGANVLMKMLNNDFNYFDEYKILNDEFIIKGGDLYSYINLPNKLYDKELRVENKYIRKYSQENHKNDVVVYSSNDYLYNKRLMIIGDSFRKALVPKIAGLYKNLISIHSNKYDPTMIEQYKPDIIVIMRPERYSNLVFNFHL